MQAPSSVALPAGQESRTLIVCLLLVVATLAFYNPIVHNQFTGFDDWNYILINPQVQHGLTWDTIKWSFTTYYDGIWHPLTWLSHALDCQIFGVNPVGHHYTNVLLHALNAVLLFLLLRSATGSFASSLLAAALFALHPINVESVAWASERKNVLSLLFLLLALYAYDRYARTGRKSLYLWVAALFALGLMAKPQIVTLPFVLLLWDYWPLNRIGAFATSAPPAAATPRSLAYLLIEKVPLFVLAIAASIITVFAQRAGNAVRTVSEVSLSSRLENAVVSYVRYLGKAFWPSGLAPMYPRREGLLPVGQVVGALFILLVISLFVVYWRDRRYLTVGWLWFLGTLVPMIGIVTVGDQAMADRYAYLPLIGLFVALVWAFDALAGAYHVPNVWRVTVALVVLGALGCITYRQVGFWRDDDILWHYTLRVTDGNYVAHNNLALMFAKAGRSEDAVAEFRAAKSLHKYPPDQVLALALYELRVGHPEYAIEECDSVLRASSDPKIQGVAWAQRGQAHLLLRQYDQAADGYRNALRVAPENEMALLGSGLLALRQGQSDAAVSAFTTAVKVDPNDVDLLLLAQALRRAGRSADADTATAQAQKVSSHPADAQQTVAEALASVGLKPL